MGSGSFAYQRSAESLVAADRPAGNDLHEFVAIPFLRGVFSDAVIEPIRLHVDAKRYLCAAVIG